MTSEELSQCSALQGLAIVYFGNEWNAENRTSSHHIACRLPDRCPVLYVDSPGMRTPKASARDVRRLFRKLRQMLRKPVSIGENLWHCTIPQIPFRRIPGITRLNRAFGRWAVRRAIRSVGFGRVISWFVVPHPGFLATRLGEEFVVYYCIDDYAAHPGVDAVAIGAADAQLTRTADVVFVAPPSLVDTKQQLNSATVFSPHGVDFDLFSNASRPDTAIPDRAAALPHPVVGYFGSIADWIDTDLLLFLGRERPDWTFLMVGHASTDVSELKRLPNFVFVGAQLYESLPGWAAAFDVAIMPYRNNRQVANANPLKLREYLATGKPVVSTPTLEVRRFSEHVHIAESPQAFLAALTRALAEDTVDTGAARMDAVRGMSWDARVDTTLAVVCERLKQKADCTGKGRQ